MPESPSEQEVEELVDFLVRKKISRQMAKKVVSQVEQIEHQELIEKRSSRFLLPLLVVSAVIIALLLAMNLKS